MPPLIRVDNREILDQLVAQKKRVQKSNPTMKKGGSLITRVQNICEQVQKRLGHYKDELGLINTKEDLHKYIDACIKNDIASIDTETTGLDTFCDKIVGACLYTYGEKPVYVPINHVSYLTNIRCANQLTEAEVAEEFQRLVDAQTKVIMFNAKFDIRVIRHQLGVYMIPAWCGFIAGKCLKENEPEGNLKFLWKKYCSPDKEAEHFTFDKMFDGLRFDLIPIDTAYLYAAKDALMTLELYDFQKPYLTPDDPKCIEGDLTRLAKLYREIELPIIPIVADIEDQGVVIDTELSKKMSADFTARLKVAEKEFADALKPYEQEIAAYKAAHPDSKLENPVNMNSPVQLSELFYDVLKVPAVSKKDPKGTGKEILKALGHPLCEPILKYKNIAKLLSTYIDALPELVNKKTGRLHCNFNQYGADTGRFSSSNPNFQNIPSKEKSIRHLFTATKELTVSSDGDNLELLWGDTVVTLHGEKDAQDLIVGDVLVADDGNYTITAITNNEDFYNFTISKVGTLNT